MVDTLGYRNTNTSHIHPHIYIYIYNCICKWKYKKFKADHLTDRVIYHANTMADTVVDTSNGVVTIQWTLFQVSSHLTTSIWRHNICLWHSGTCRYFWMLFKYIVYIKDAWGRTCLCVPFAKYKTTRKICLRRVQSPYHPNTIAPWGGMKWLERWPQNNR